MKKIVYLFLKMRTFTFKDYNIYILKKKKYKYYLIVNVYNEGKRLEKFLTKIKKKNFGVIIADSPSNDNSTNLFLMKKLNVDIVLKMKKRSDHSKTLISCIKYLYKENIDGIVISDGNGKDHPKYVRKFIKKLSCGFDFIQGSRFIKGGFERNTPILRKLLIKYIHAPLTSLACRKKFTDSTNGFRAISMSFIKKNYKNLIKMQLKYYEFYFCLPFLASRKKLKVCEIPVSRVYPKNFVPTKIQTINQYWQMIKPIILQCLGLKYNFK